jgi:hypothetical protein
MLSYAALHRFDLGSKALLGREVCVLNTLPPLTVGRVVVFDIDTLDSALEDTAKSLGIHHSRDI